MIKEIAAISLSLFISFLIALGGSYNGFAIDEVAIIFHCFLITYGIQLIVFIPSYIFTTEKFFDLTGMITYLTIMGYIIYIRGFDTLNYTGLVLIVLISIWALRLGLFLFFRIHKDGNDRRFNELKINFLKFLRTWTLQGLWVFLTASCAIVVLSSEIITDNILFIIMGSFFWILGFSIEFISDLQKRQFKKNHKEGFITSGLWSYSRHPNYLGEILLWFGIAVICFPTLEGAQYASLISPIFVYLLLTRISGVNLLEEYADKKWGGLDSYQEYKKRTPILFPIKK